MLREADLDILRKLGKQGLDWRFEPDGFRRREAPLAARLAEFKVGGRRA
jgi:hypothetical protein